MEATSTGTDTSPSDASGSGATAIRVHLLLVVLGILGVFVQVYLAGRGAFGADTYEAHKNFGQMLPIIAVALIVSAAVGARTRNRQDIGMAVGLLVLYVIQMIIGNRDHPELGALHPVNALLIVGLSFGILSRTKAHLKGA